MRKYNEESLRKAIIQNYSIRGVLRTLGLAAAGGNYESIKRLIEKLSLDTSHFTGQGHLRGKKNTYRIRPLDNILVFGRLENTYRLKNRLIKDGLKKRNCECCKLTMWNYLPMPLELHHKDGERRNNVLNNLELLCPNCHAQTDNYRGKNKKCRGQTATT